MGFSTVFGSPALLSVLGSTLLTNLKEAGELGLNEGTNYRPSVNSVSNIEFCEGRVPDNGFCERAVPDIDNCERAVHAAPEESVTFDSESTQGNSFYLL